MGEKDYQRSVEGGHRDSVISAANVCGFSFHSRHEGSAAGSSKFAYALIRGVCPDRRQARRTVSARLEVAM